MRFALMSACLLSSMCVAGDWPQFRGPNASGVAADSVVPAKFGPTENVRWKVDVVGRSVASPVVVDGRIYVTSASGVRGDRLHVLCYALADGKLLWERRMTATGNTGCHPKSSMAAPTAVADKDGVYALFATGDLAAFTPDGTLKWYRSLVGDYPKIGNQVGMASSPVLFKNTLIVPMDNQGESFLAGIDTQYGRNTWKVDRPREVNWVSPTLRATGDKAEVLFSSRTDLSSYDAVTGQKLWSYPTGSGGIPTPILMGEKILLPGSPLVCLKIVDGRPVEEWKSPKLSSGSNSPVIRGDRIYNINGAGVLICADASTGKDLWQERLKGKFWASPVIAGTVLFASNDTGSVFSVELGEKGRILATNDLGEEIMGTPAISGNNLVILTDKHLWCIAETKK